MYFSLNGQEFQEQPIISRPKEESTSEMAKNVSISLQHKIARFIKLQFFFSSQWMLMSEIAFDTGEWEKPRSIAVDNYSFYIPNLAFYKSSPAFLKSN